MSMMLFDFQNSLLRKRDEPLFLKSWGQRMNMKRKHIFIDLKSWKKVGETKLGALRWIDFPDIMLLQIQSGSGQCHFDKG